MPERCPPFHSSHSKHIISSHNTMLKVDKAAERHWIEELSETLSEGAHMKPVEKGSISMLELNEAMKWDNALQHDLVQFCAEMLEDTVERNDDRKKVCELKSFVGRVAPIAPAQYVKRIFRHSRCSPCCLVVACIYLQRLKDRNRTTYLTYTSFQRMFAVAVMLAAKFLDDHFFSNKHWAEIAGISNKEMNALEVEFLFRVGFELNVTREEYNLYVDSMTFGRRDEAPDSYIDAKQFAYVCKVRSYTDVSEAPVELSIQ